MSYPLAVDILGINVLVVRAQKCLRHPGYNVVTGLTVKAAPPSPAPAALAMPGVWVKRGEAGGQHRRTLTARPPNKQTPIYAAPSRGDQLSPGNVHLSFRIWVL